MYWGVPTTMPLWVSCRRAGGLQRPRDAEVHDHRVAAGEHDVVRLDVAVDHAVFVGIPERAADFAGDLHRRVDRELRFAREPLPQRLALDERHDVIDQAAGLARVVEWEDVRVLECGGDRDFAEEPVAAEGGRDLGLEQLDGHTALVLEVLGEEDDGHPALTQLALDAVAVTDSRRDLLEESQAPALLWTEAGNVLPSGP